MPTLFITVGIEMKNKKISFKLFFMIALISCSILLSSNHSTGLSSTKLSLDPLTITAQAVNEEITVKLTITDVQSLWMYSVNITWDPAVLSLVGDPTEGAFLKQSGTTLFQSTLAVPGKTPDVTSMYLAISDSLMTNDTVSGNGDLVTMKFKVLKAAIESPIYIAGSELLGPNVGSYDSPINIPITHQIQSPAMFSFMPEGAVIANAGLPQNVDEGIPVTLNASKTMPKSNDLNFTWIFFDSEEKTLTGMIANYTFEIPGNYNITLTVRNANGTESRDQTVINVIDITPPIVKITYDTGNPSNIAVAWKEISFIGRESYDPDNGTIDTSSYLWNFGDGTEPEHSRETTHTFSNTGIYNVTFTLRDTRGNLTGTDSIMLTVTQNYNVDTPSANVNQQEALPPTIIAVIIAVTAATIAGSAFWLTGSKKFLNH
jgi:hypothetical protein